MRLTARGPGMKSVSGIAFPPEALGSLVPEALQYAEHATVGGRIIVLL